MDDIYKPGQEVDLVILRETDLGFVAKINGQHEGLLYHDEIFRELWIGDEITGYINRLRPDGTIDLLLRSFGNFGAEELGDEILEILEENNGFVPVNTKSSAEEIYKVFGVSRKKFKMALGGLYKKRLVQFTDKGTELIKKAK